MWDAFDDDTSGLDGTGGGWEGVSVITDWRYIPTRAADAEERIASQVYYMEQRDGYEETPHALFTADADAMDRADARALLRASQGRYVAAHRYILSPSKGLGLTTDGDIRAWVRVTMDAYGQHLGRELVYVASVHANGKHPHAHVLIAGKGRVTTPRVRPRCTHKDVYIHVPDHARLKELGIEAARPIAEARASLDRSARRERQAARMAALDARLGIA